MSRANSSIFRPELEDLTENERAWVGIFRLLTYDSDPAPTLARVQALRQAMNTTLGRCRKG
nr:hypothetical protein [Kandeliimicrobium roseum]